jgi:hypothetical protein
MVVATTSAPGSMGGGLGGVDVRGPPSLHALLSGEEAVVDLTRQYTTIIGNNLDKGIILAIESLKNEAHKL